MLEDKCAITTTTTKQNCQMRILPAISIVKVVMFQIANNLLLIALRQVTL